MSKNNKFDKSTTNNWNSILEEIEIKAIPIEYINEIKVDLADGRTISIDVLQEKINEENLDVIDESLQEFFEYYDEIIDNIDFKIDTEKLKKDISARTRTFLKKRK